MFRQIRIYPIYKELLFHQVAAGWHLPSLAIKEMEGPMEVSNLFGISTFRSDISSPTPITEAIQLWLKLKSSKFWEPCPSEEQEFLNWTLIKWWKASSRDETQFKRKIKFKTDSLYSTQLVVFWQCPYIYELIVPHAPFASLLISCTVRSKHISAKILTPLLFRWVYNSTGVDQGLTLQWTFPWDSISVNSVKGLS